MPDIYTYIYTLLVYLINPFYLFSFYVCFIKPIFVHTYLNRNSLTIILIIKIYMRNKSTICYKYCNSHLEQEQIMNIQIVYSYKNSLGSCIKAYSLHHKHFNITCCQIYYTTYDSSFSCSQVEVIPALVPLNYGGRTRYFGDSQ